MEVELFYENGRTESHDEAKTPFRSFTKAPKTRRSRLAENSNSVYLCAASCHAVTNDIGQTKAPVYLSLCNMSTHYPHGLVFPQDHTRDTTERNSERQA